MHLFLSAFPECVAASVFLLPQFWYLHKTRFRSIHASILFFLFALYLSAVYAVAGLPTLFFLRFNPHFNFVPFLYMFSAHRTSILNVILFVPLGSFLVILWPRFENVLLTVFSGLFLSLLIESLQIFTFRATDVNDLITNTLGTLLGYLLGKAILKCFPSVRPITKKRDLGIICICVFLTMFFLQPFSSALLWRILP